MKRNGCYFCQKNTNPDYKEYEMLKRFLTLRGKMMSREKSAVCALHQRKLAQEIKKARILSLLPFVIYES